MLSYVVLDFSWVFVIVLILIWLRIFATKNLKVILLASCFSLLLIIRLNFWQATLNKQAYFTEQEFSQQHFLVYPDTCKVNGNLLSFQAKWIEKKQNVMGYYTLQNESEKNYWQKNLKTLMLSATGTVEVLSSPTNENQFDYQKYMLSKNIINACNFDNLSSVAVNVNFFTKFIASLHDLRWKWLMQLQDYPQPLGWYAQVLLLGYQSQDFSEISAAISKLGLLYLFSLSGMHVFYLVEAVRKFFRYLHLTKQSTLTFLLCILPLYAILGGGAISLVRSLAMSWLRLVSQKFYRHKITATTAWAIVLIINLFWLPASIFALGAQLSYLLTLILVMKRPKNQWFLGIKMSGYSIPLMLWHTFEWNIWTTLFSIVINPVFEWLILPSVLLGLLPSFSQGCNYLLKLMTELLQNLATWQGMIVFGKPALWCVFLMLGLLIACENQRHCLIKLSLLGLVYVGSYLSIHYPLNNEVVYFDIGQGDATLIREKYNRHVILIDTGGQLDFSTATWQKRDSKTKGETVIANYLLSKGISQIDTLYLTHQDTDHVGNFPSLSQCVKIKKICVPAGMAQLSSFQQRLQLSTNSLNDVFEVTDQTGQLDLGYQILHPFTVGQGANEDSLVLYTQLEGVRFIFSGDLDQENEQAVLQKYPNLQVDVLKTGHHGSKTSTNESYVRDLGPPKLAIISAGKNNRYGHPNQETLATLDKLQVPYLITAQVGMIKIIPKNQQIQIQTYAKGAFYDNSTRIHQ